MTISSFDVKKGLIPWLKRLSAVSPIWYVYHDYAVDQLEKGTRNYASFPLGKSWGPILPYFSELHMIYLGEMSEESDETTPPPYVEPANPITLIGEIKGKNTYSLEQFPDALSLRINENYYAIAVRVRNPEILNNEKVVLPDSLSEVRANYPEVWEMSSDALQGFRNKEVITVTTPEYKGKHPSLVRLTKNKFPFIGVDQVKRDPKYRIRYAIGEPNLGEEASQALSKSIVKPDNIMGLLLITEFFGDLAFCGYSERVFVVY